MTDDLLRHLERSWRLDLEDTLALDAYLDALRRAGLDPVESLAAAAGEAPFAGLLRASLPIVRSGPNGEAFGRRLTLFVWNGTHFVTKVDVFADGLIDAWGSVDRALFAIKLSEDVGSLGPPVVTAAPEGARFSIHNLGGAVVADGTWLAKPADVIRAVDLILRALSVAGAPLLDMEGTDTEEVDGVRTSKLPLSSGRPYRRTARGEVVRGETLPVLLREGSGGWALSSWIIYEDGLSQLGARGALLPVAEAGARFQSGEATTRMEEGETLTLPGLGHLRAAGPAMWYVESAARVAEALDTLETLSGRTGADERCREAFDEYERQEELPRDESGAENPELTAARERLRAAYEAVPEHLRMYLGDMDSKDWPIRRALGLEAELGADEELGEDDHLE